MSTAVDLTVDPQTLRRWRNAIGLAFGIGGITVAAWGPRLPAVMADLSVDTATMGLLLAGVTIGSISGLLGSTPLLHWLGSRRAIASSILGIATGMALMGAAVWLGWPALVCIAFALVGFGVGAMDVLINVEGAVVERIAGKTLLPMLHGMWSVGAAVGAGIGAACAALGITPSAQFLGEAVLIAVLAAVIGPAIVGHDELASEPETRTAREKLREWARGWLDVRLLLIGVVMLGVELAEGSANNWLTLAVHDEHGQTAAIAALFFAAFAASEACARIFGGPVVDRLGRVNAIRYTTAIGVLGLVLFIFGATPWLILVGVVLWALGVSMGFPLGMTAAADSGPNPAARVSIVASIGYLANLAGPPAIGILAETTGLLNSMWLVVALMVAGFSAAGALRPTRPS